MSSIVWLTLTSSQRSRMARCAIPWFTSSAMSCQKLDRILMSKEWENLFHAVLAYKKPRDLSYHNPLIIDTQFSPKKQRRIFKFELHWLDHSEFLPKIKDIWQGPTRDNSALSRVLLN
jgi:hypothetical protein